MEYLNNSNTLCLTYDELVPAIMPEGTYKYNKSEGNIIVHGVGGNGRRVLIEYNSLSDKHKALAYAIYGNVYEYAAKQPLLNLLVTDIAARNYFAKYRRPDGQPLSEAQQKKFSRQADWLNMINTITQDKKVLRETLGVNMAECWKIIISLHQKDAPVNPKLPKNYIRLLGKLNEYKDKGYASLVNEKQLCNNNARKVTDKIEQIILSLYCMDSNPYLRGVCNDFNRFMAGELQVVDNDGVLYNPQDFYVKGEPYELTESTVKYYIEKPLNKITVQQYRLSKYEFNNKVRPYHHRNSSMYSFSMFSMDDTKSPFKMRNNERPATYKIFDVASTALVAIAMTPEDANADLIREVIKNMMRVIVRNGWKMPYEIEVERAITTSMMGYKDDNGDWVNDVLTNKIVFGNVRVCRARNPQEKSAEGFIRALKMGYQKHRQGFQARPFARLDAHRMNEDKDKVRYDYAEIVTMENEDMNAYNYAPHPNQKKYPGMTRWQVLEQCQNPNLSEPNMPMIMPYIGDGVNTTLERGYVQVQYSKYQLENMDVLALLQHTSFTAHYISEENGNVSNVYLYQDGKYICKANKVQKYQKARIERTDADYAIKKEQDAYIEGFDNIVNRNAERVLPLGTIPTSELEGVTSLNSTNEQEAELQKIALNNGGYEQDLGGNDTDAEAIESAEARALRDL